MKRNIILILILLLILSCSKNDNIPSTNDKLPNQILNNGLEKKEVKKEEIIYNEKRDELSIGDNVLIKRGLSSNIESKVPIFNKVDTYTNSNVDNYIFFIVNDSSVDKIGSYYNNFFKTNGYYRKIPDSTKNHIEDEIKRLKQEGEDIPTFNSLLPKGNLTFIKKGVKKFTIIDEAGKEIQKNEIFDKEKIVIIIRDQTPKNIRDGMGLEGIFVEIYYTSFD